MLFALVLGVIFGVTGVLLVQQWARGHLATAAAEGLLPAERLRELTPAVRSVRAVRSIR